MPESSEPAGIGLADAIREVRRELQQAMKEGQGSVLAFEADRVELEFEIGFAKTLGGSGGVQVWVLSLGAKGERTATGSHRINVQLTPVIRGVSKDRDKDEKEPLNISQKPQLR